MFRKYILTLMLLPLISLAVADDPNNPGDDNPGTTYDYYDYAVGDFFTDDDSCFETSTFCTDSFIYPPEEQLRGKKKAAEAMAAAEEFSALACVAAAEANAALAWFYEGSGSLTLARHGNHGSMHRIKLEADLAAASITVADAGAEAGAGAVAYAYAFAQAESVAEACDEILAEGDPDTELVEFCAAAAATANANSQALALAASLASSESFAASGSYGAAAIHNEVWAANIEKYQTALTTGAGSFSFADAEASAEAFALAYADAYAYAFAQACAGAGAQDLEICSDGFDDDAQAYALAYAYAYAEAQATALAAVEITVSVPVMYKNENGIYDTVIFGPNDDPYDFAFVDTTCAVPEEPVE